MAALEQIQTIRSMNIIEDTTGDYNQTDRNKLVAESIGRVDVTSLTQDEAAILNWPKWSEELPMVLVPLYLYDYFEYGQTLICIDGTETVVQPNYDDVNKSHYIDNDTRGQFLAYGFIPKEI